MSTLRLGSVLARSRHSWRDAAQPLGFGFSPSHPRSGGSAVADDVKIARAKRRRAPPDSSRLPETSAIGMPKAPSEPQQSACKSAARSGATFARSATVASIMTSGMAKLTLQNKSIRPAVKRLNLDSGVAASDNDPTMPRKPARSMYGPRCLPPIGSASLSTPNRLFSCHGMRENPTSRAAVDASSCMPSKMKYLRAVKTSASPMP